jgi:gag-polypeptide of LTR copia-type
MSTRYQTPRSSRKGKYDTRTPTNQTPTNTSAINNNRKNTINNNNLTMSTITANNIDTAIRVILFSGKHNDWFDWEEKFLARAKRKGLKALYIGKPEDVPVTSKTNLTSDEAKLVELNEIAYSELIMSIDTSTAAGKVAFGLVKASKSKDYPDGNAATSWKRLKGKYMPDTAPTVTRLSQEFYSSRLFEGHDPDIWLTKLEFKRLQMEEMGSDMTDDAFMTYVINNLTKDYENLVDTLGRRVGKYAKDKLTIEELRQELNLRFQRLKKYNNDNNNNNGKRDEQVMYAGAKFKGKCRHCGKYGHKIAGCWERNPNLKTSGNTNNSNNNNNNNHYRNNGNNNGNNNSGNGYNYNNNNNGTRKFNGKCNYCQIIGHKEADCYKKKRDNGNNNDKAAAATQVENNDNNNGNSGNNNQSSTPENNFYHEEFVDHVYMAQENNHVSLNDDDTNQTLTTLINEQTLESFKGEVNCMGKCRLCDHVGPLYNYCVQCVDTGMIYDKIHDESTHNANNTLKFKNQIISAVKGSTPETEIFIFIFQVYDHVYGVSEKSVNNQDKFIAEWASIYNKFNITQVTHVIQEVRKLLSDDDLIEREDIAEEIDGMLIVGVEWLLQLHQRCEPTSKNNINSVNENNNDMVFLLTIANNMQQSQQHLWIADSGASCHMTNPKEGMSSLVKTENRI